jgi:pimeloyl-ACP methyl ester carboxylesterase
MTNQPSQHFLAVADGKVYYEVRGSGPLLLVVGQPMTSGPFAPIADLLAEDHTVVTYDPHGVGESVMDDPPELVTPEIEADDLAQIIDAVGGGPADIFGSSGGAVAGLALAANHPHKVGTLIAHEPPVGELLPDAAQARAAVDGIEEAYRAYGSGAAWGKFISLVMHDGPIPDDGPPPATWPPPGAEPPEGAEPAENAAPPEPSAKQQADDETFFVRMLKPFTRYQPPIEALRSGPRVVVAVGAASRGEMARRSADALAERLGQTATQFPGDHGGFMSDPPAFAAAIRQVLAQGR